MDQVGGAGGGGGSDARRDEAFPRPADGPPENEEKCETSRRGTGLAGEGEDGVGERNGSEAQQGEQCGGDCFSGSILAPLLTTGIHSEIYDEHDRSG